MKNISLMKKCNPYFVFIVTVFIVVVFLVGSAKAQGDPVSNPICDNLESRLAQGLCYAAVAAGCGTTEIASSIACETISQMFTEVTGEEPNWICPCYNSLDIDQAFAEGTAEQDVIGFSCYDSVTETELFTEIWGVYSLSGSSAVLFNIGNVQWELGLPYWFRVCEGNHHEINDLNISQAHACRQAILESTVWKASGCPESSIYP